MPQTTQDIIRIIKTQDEAMISNILHDLIDAHEKAEGAESRKAYLRYKQTQDGVPIFGKEFANYEKAHERIPNDFYGDIVDLKTGYMGNEITMEIDKRKVPSDGERERIDLFLGDFAKENALLDENSELVKMAAITGRTYRVLFVSAEDGKAKIMNSDPWETVIYRDGSIKTPTAAMRYYRVEDILFTPGGKPKRDTKWRVEWYDDTEITYYIEDSDNKFIVDTSQPADGAFAGTGRQPHFFSGVPVIEFKNNEEDMGEAQKVVDLIDAYDTIISDGASEIEQLRMAYMWARGAGMSLDEEFEKQLTQTGIWPLPQDGEIGFASKDLGGASEFVTTVLGEIRRNIYSFAKSLDLSQDRGGDMRVIGWQIAMLRLEMSAQVTERKFKKSYQRQYKLLTDFWRDRKATAIDPMALRFIFTRKFPKDIDQELDTLIKAIETMPLENAYALMTFVENPAELAEQYRAERNDMQSILNGIDQAGV